MTMEQTVAQLQQEELALKTRVAADSGFSEAFRAINSLTMMSSTLSVTRGSW